MAAITLGLGWLMKLGRTRRRVWYKLNRHVICFGPTRSGKGVTLEIPNLLRLKGLSIISIDPKGQNAAVTGRWRRKVGKVVLLNPLNLLGLGSAGFNPLAALLVALRNKSPRYFEDASAIAEALIKIQGKDPFFDLMARGLMLALILWEVKSALDQDRVPLLENVRGMLTGDLPATAKAIFNSGDFQMASLAGRYRETSKTNDSIIASAEAQTQWMLSRPVLDDLAKDGIDFATLKTEATTVFVIPPADALETFSVWLRLVINSALNALYRQGGGGLRTLFMLSEFAALGKLDMVATALGQGAGFGIQLFPVLQDINQLREIYGKDAANTFLGMSGATFAFTPNDPETAEWMSKRAGDVVIPGLTVSQNAQGDLNIGMRPERQRAVPPDDLFNIPEFHGLVFFAGQSQAQPVYAPPYWDRDGNPDLVGRFDPDPYHPGSAAGGRRRILRRLVRATAGAALAAVVVLGGAVLLHPSSLHALVPPVFHHPVRR
jgi:type IV secretion system protein VirD4